MLEFTIFLVDRNSKITNPFVKPVISVIEDSPSILKLLVVSLSSKTLFSQMISWVLLLFSSLIWVWISQIESSCSLHATNNFSKL